MVRLVQNLASLCRPRYVSAPLHDLKLLYVYRDSLFLKERRLTRLQETKLARPSHPKASSASIHLIVLWFKKNPLLALSIDVINLAKRSPRHVPYSNPRPFLHQQKSTVLDRAYKSPFDKIGMKHQWGSCVRYRISVPMLIEGFAVGLVYIGRCAGRIRKLEGVWVR